MIAFFVKIVKFSWSLWCDYVFNVIFKIVRFILPSNTHSILLLLIWLGLCIGAFIVIAGFSLAVLKRIRELAKEKNFMLYLGTWALTGAVLFVVYTPLAVLFIAGSMLDGASSATSNSTYYEINNHSSHSKRCSRCGTEIVPFSNHRCI